jgi:hypothetical protein
MRYLFVANHDLIDVFFSDHTGRTYKAMGVMEIYQYLPGKRSEDVKIWLAWMVNKVILGEKRYAGLGYYGYKIRGRKKRVKKILKHLKRMAGY